MVERSELSIFWLWHYCSKGCIFEVIVIVQHSPVYIIDKESVIVKEGQILAILFDQRVVQSGIPYLLAFELSAQFLLTVFYS